MGRVSWCGDDLGILLLARSRRGFRRRRVSLGMVEDWDLSTCMLLVLLDAPNRLNFPLHELSSNLNWAGMGFHDMEAHKVQRDSEGCARFYHLLHRYRVPVDIPRIGKDLVLHEFRFKVGVRALRHITLYPDRESNNIRKGSMTRALLPTLAWNM